jgi:hypothetical protein
MRAIAKVGSIPTRFTCLIFNHLGDFDMRWRDIRFEKPTEADADELFSEVAFIRADGIKCVRNFQSFDGDDYVAWMPLSELPAFDPIPDPPEGWRFVEKGEAFDKRAKFWNQHKATFLEVGLDFYLDSNIYIVPIDPPSPQYRPFANAAEFEPYFGRMIKEKSLDDFRTVVTSFSDKGVWLAGGSIATGYCEAFDIYEFANGFPFGVKVEP